jgi:membrane fusion protein (multidrug efflux system)
VRAPHAAARARAERIAACRQKKAYKAAGGAHGVVANRKTRVGEYVTAGTRMLSIVPISDLWVEAN